MKSFINNKLYLISVPDNRVEGIKKVIDGKKSLVFSFIPAITDGGENEEISLGSVLFEQNENLGMEVANCCVLTQDHGQTIILQAAFDVCLANIIAEIKTMKKEDRPEILYISGNFNKKMSQEIGLTIQSNLITAGLKDADIFIETKEEKWYLDLDDEDEDEDIKKKDKKKKKKKKK